MRDLSGKGSFFKKGILRKTLYVERKRRLCVLRERAFRTIAPPPSQKDKAVLKTTARQENSIWELSWVARFSPPWTLAADGEG